MIYQFTLTDYTINPLGISTIIEEPNGWDGMELSLKRDDETHGIFFDCSIDSLEFYGEGAAIIKTAYDLQKVEAKIEHIDGYSSRKDSEHLVEFVSDTAKTVKKVFVVMGETNTSLFFAQRARDYLGVNAVHPEEGDTVVLD